MCFRLDRFLIVLIYKETMEVISTCDFQISGVQPSFSADGKLLISTALDGTLRFWGGA
jgi:WD40 repeat protein